mmetsp:Transcript_21909/g.59989  ORF Transcript_21909/g.59989 Transcript_21909/m.59989 type:complete len:720 (-) Transcript_21909:99-2258(-)
MPGKTSNKSKGRKSPATKNTGAKGRSASGENGLDPDLEEDVDRFMKNRNKNLFADDDAVGSDGEEEEEEEIMGIGGDDDDEDDDDEEQPLLDSDMEGEEEDEEDEEEGWGKRRSDYYDADEADDSEAEAEEEKEALRLRAKQSASLRAEDFGEDEVASDDDEDTIAAAVAASDKPGSKKAKKDDKNTKASPADKKGKKDKKVKKAEPVQDDDDEDLLLLDGDGAAAMVEKVERDLAGLSKEERRAILENDSPELMALLADLRRHLAEVRQRLLPLREKVRSGAVPTGSGVSYLELRLQILLSYCTNVAFYLVLKAEGKSVRSHPVIEQLVELRTLMDKMRPLDAKLRYQMDKLLKAPAQGEEATGDALRFKPNPDALAAAEGLAAADEEDMEDAAEAGGVDGVYRPPRIAAAHFEDKAEARERRAKEKRARKAARSELVSALREEFEDTPAEMPSIGSFAQYKDAEEDHRTKFEEDNFMRLAVTKKDRARRNEARRKVDQGGGLNELFETFDDLGGLDEGGTGKESTRALKKRSLKEYMDSQDQDRRNAKRKELSGEADVPARDRQALVRDAERRRQGIEMAKRARNGGGGSDSDGGGGGSDFGEEDDLYREVAQSKATKKAEKKERYTRTPAPYREEAEVEEDGRRGADRAIVGNRGLVPHRSKDKKNPRLRHRNKFEKAKVKERTSMYGRQKRQDGDRSYAGEATGIKPNIARSRKL